MWLITVSLSKLSEKHIFTFSLFSQTSLKKGYNLCFYIYFNAMYIFVLYVVLFYIIYLETMNLPLWDCFPFPYTSISNVSFICFFRF